MEQLILPYLAKYKSLTIQDIGNFKVENISPNWVAIEEILTAPSIQVVFEADQVPTSQGFIDYVANKLKLTTIESNLHIQNKIEIILAHCKQNAKVEIQGLGFLKKEGEHIAFEANNITIALPVNATRVIRKDEEHFIRVGEQEKTNLQMHEFYTQNNAVSSFSWWTYAWIITLITVGYLAFYFFKYNGF